MMLDAVACLLFAVMVFMAGGWLVQHWRVLGDYATQFVDRDVLFGAAGERVLIPWGVLLMAAGVYVATQALAILGT